MIWTTSQVKSRLFHALVLSLCAAQSLAQTDGRSSLLARYLESPDTKLYVSCSSGDHAVWGQENVYEAYRNISTEVKGGISVGIGRDCVLKYINNDPFWLDRVSWQDPTALYRNTKGKKTLLTCEYGFKVFGKGFDQRKAEQAAVDRARRQGLTNCKVFTGETARNKVTKVARGGTAETEIYNIDLLKIKHTYRGDSLCASGLINEFELTGVIGPDSTFAMKRLLERNPACRDSSGSVVVPPVISLSSNGGLLEDGYALGRELRRLNATALIDAEKQCASSCAVAFLGGTRRVIDEEALVMFHAPYFSGENAIGKRDISCDVGEKGLAELRAYYQEMTDAETGDRLFERTMWYCSANDGWVVKGASAAELYGIATEK